jgi:aminoglycoside phosphotransferase (APT) family kinase protein
MRRCRVWRLPIARRSTTTSTACSHGLHSVDYEKIGMGDFGRPGDFIERQMTRFIKQYRGAETDPIPEMEELIAALPSRVPGNRRTAIVHGDFKLGNMITHPTEPRLMAVLDWELATIGDPLADLAFSAFAWHRTTGERAPITFDPASGIPSEADYVRAYCRRTGRDGIEGWNFYLAFGLFRLASIMQGVYRRVLDGTVASNFAAVNTARRWHARRWRCSRTRSSRRFRSCLAPSGRATRCVASAALESHGSGKSTQVTFQKSSSRD